MNNSVYHLPKGLLNEEESVYHLPTGLLNDEHTKPNASSKTVFSPTKLRPNSLSFQPSYVSVAKLSAKKRKSRKTRRSRSTRRK